MNLNSLRDIFSQLKWSIMNIPHIRIGDIVDILIVAYLIYKIITWIKDTRAWALFKGLVVIFSAAIIAYVFRLNTVWWILSNTISVGIIAVFVVFQPEFRRALEQLGRGRFFSTFMVFDEQREGEEKISSNTIEAIVKAIEHLSDNKIGALIVIEKNVKLGEYERTGIKVDAIVTAQLLINIFQQNTPLHDGAVIIKNNRISAATCYLPLTDSLEISKELGTRHRAALGISEVSDAITIVVSEETGIISVTDSGSLTRNIKGEFIRTMLRDSSSKKMDRKNLCYGRVDIGMNDLLGKDIGWKVFSLVLAIGLWFIVINIKNPEETMTFTIPVEIQNLNVIEANNLIIANFDEIEDKHITLNIRGTRLTLDKLKNNKKYLDVIKATANLELYRYTKASEVNKIL